MNELSIAAKFMTWVIGVVVALGLFGELKPLTYKMAEAAIDAQQHQSLTVLFPANFGRRGTRTRINWLPLTRSQKVP